MSKASQVWAGGRGMMRRKISLMEWKFRLSKRLNSTEWLEARESKQEILDEAGHVGID